MSDSVTNTIRFYDLSTTSVTTIAGNPGDAGFLNSNGGAPSLFNDPTALSLDDDAGMLYVADTLNCAIRSVDLATLNVSTLAGRGHCDGGGVDGDAGTATFLYPRGVAVDGAGNLLVADTGDDTIRRISLATGIVTTIAGKEGVALDADGMGTGATFDGPLGLALDGVGSLYITDPDAGSIRRMVLDGGTVLTLVSGKVTADAGLGEPTGVAYGGTPGTLFVTGNDAIWFTDGGMLSTVVGMPGGAGNSDALGHFNSPGGLVNVVSQGKLLVADTGNDTIRVVDLALGSVVTPAGTAPHPGASDDAGALATFDLPGGIASDGINLYVADTGSNTIRQVTLAGGIVSTLAGVAFDAGSNDGVGTTARFNGPTGLAYDGFGNLFVSDTGNDTIREIALDGGDVTTVAGTAGVAGDAGGPPLTATFNEPTGLALSVANGYLAVADTNNASISQIAYSNGQLGTVSFLAGKDTGNTVALPTGITVVDGYVVFTDRGNNTVSVIFSGGVNPLVGTPNVAGWLDSPSFTFGGPFTTLLSHPDGITFAAPSSFYIADTGNSAVRLLTFDPTELTNLLTGGSASGALATLIGTPGQSGVLLGPSPAGLNGPAGLAYVASPIPTLFISDTTENVILQAQ